MSFFNKFFGRPTSAAAAAQSQAPPLAASAASAGWQIHTVDGVTMYLNPTTGKMSMTPLPTPTATEAVLPHGWKLTDIDGNPYYVGPIYDFIENKNKMYLQRERPTWRGSPSAIRLSPKWEEIFRGKQYGGPSVVIYENKKTHEKTQHFPLADGDDLRKILEVEKAESYGFTEGQNHHGGKNKRKQSKRKQSKRKQSKRNATRRRMM